MAKCPGIVDVFCSGKPGWNTVMYAPTFLHTIQLSLSFNLIVSHEILCTCYSRLSDSILRFWRLSSQLGAGSSRPLSGTGEACTETQTGAEARTETQARTETR